MKACCEAFGVPMDLCLSESDVNSERSRIKLDVKQDSGKDLLNVLEYCYSTSISPDNHGNEWAPWSNDPGNQIPIPYWFYKWLKETKSF